MLFRALLKGHDDLGRGGPLPKSLAKLSEKETP